MNRFVELPAAQATLAELIDRVAQGDTVVITNAGRPVASLGPVAAMPGHRDKETRRGVTLAPQFEPADARLARIERSGDVPHRLRDLPKH